MRDKTRDINETVRREVLTSVRELCVRETADGTESRRIEGYAVLFGVKSEPLWSDSEIEVREVIASGAVTKELLDKCDIKFTMFHDRQLILARSKNGQGTLEYSVDTRGVKFGFDAPNTVDGDKALELVRRGDLAGCSFAFTTHYWDKQFVSLDVETVDGRELRTYTVNVITNVSDFTLAADPAYADTTVEARELVASDLRDEEDESQEQPEKPEAQSQSREQVSEMRQRARRKIF